MRRVRCRVHPVARSIAAVLLCGIATSVLAAGNRLTPTLPGDVQLPTGLAAAIQRSIDPQGADGAQMLSPGDPVGGQQFGWNVAISGTTALVGSPTAEVDGVSQQGAVYVFHLVDGIWTQVQKFSADDGVEADSFGSWVEIQGSTAMVGSIRADIDGQEDQGAVYVFEESGGAWSQVQKLVSADGKTADDFGYTIRISGDQAIIGAPFADVTHIDSAGAAYVFKREGGVWSETQKLVSPEGNAADNFGVSIGFDGDQALIGAVWGDPSGVTDRGAVYAWHFDGTTWVADGEVAAAAGAAGDQFGSAIDLEGDIAVISGIGRTVGANARQGSAWVFTLDQGAWTEAATLVADDGIGNDMFGYSVAVHDGTALIGVPFATVGANFGQGAVYRYVDAGGTWSFADKLTLADGGVFALFGWALDIDASGTLVGESGRDQGTGAAWVLAPDEGIFCNGFDDDSGSCTP